VASGILKENAEPLTSSLRKSATKYLQARQIPIDKTVLEIALAEYMVKNSTLAGLESASMDLRAIERSYLSLRKSKRTADIKFSETNNKMIPATLSGLAPSNKKIGVAKRWLERNHRLYSEEFHKRVEALIEKVKASAEEKMYKGVKVLAIPLESELAEKMEKISDEVWVKEKNDLRQFVMSTMQVAKGPARQHSSSQERKAGTREERMASYNPRKDIEDARKNETRMESAGNVARRLGREFDSVGYSISEISKSNPALGDIVRGMLKRKEIQSASVEKLYTKGHLAQKAFFRAVTEFRFAEKFGAERADSLAKVIAAIGPEFPPIRKAEHSVRDGTGPEIVKFLVKNGLANWEHRGGACVGLVRSKS